jgi:RHS repeat-associated protein
MQCLERESRHRHNANTFDMMMVYVYDGLQSFATAVRSRRSLSTGKERDAESGNDYFGARYYASTLGRFMSPDWSAKVEPVPYAKLVDPQSLNLYAYVRNNPLIRIDADGHAGCKNGDFQCRMNQLWDDLHQIKKDINDLNKTVWGSTGGSTGT